jgi:head-tail adaptor
VIASASHVVKARYQADITTLTRLRFRGRILNVVGVTNLHEADAELVLQCVEVVR